MKHLPRPLILVLIFTLGCGSDNDTAGLDLIGQQKSPAVAGRPAKTEKQSNIQLLKDVVATDLLEDLYFRFTRDKWTLQTPDAHVNTIKLKQSGLDLVLAGIPLIPGRAPETALKKAIEGTITLISTGAGAVSLARTYDDAKRIIKEGRIAVMLVIEGADGFERNPSLVNQLKSKGILAVGLVAGRGNTFAESAIAPREQGGLTQKGRRFLTSLRDAKIAVDLTHASKTTFWDVREAQTGEVLVSHTACGALMAHPRNLDDLQILSLSRFGGLMGLSFNPVFLAKNGDASLETIVAHILHVRALGALDALAIGSDFGGIDPPRGMPDVGHLSKLWDALIEHGLSADEVKGIMGQNSTRFFDELHRNFGAVTHTEDEMLRPLPLDCDSVTGDIEGIPGSICDSYVRDNGVRLAPTSRHRVRLKDVVSTPVTLEIFGEPEARWQVEGQNLAGKILFHRFVQLNAEGRGQMGLPQGRGLTRLFLSPTQPSPLNEAVVWGRPAIAR